MHKKPANSDLHLLITLFSIDKLNPKKIKTYSIYYNLFGKKLNILSLKHNLNGNS